jgi:hypothetical protein
MHGHSFLDPSCPRCMLLVQADQDARAIADAQRGKRPRGIAAEMARRGMQPADMTKGMRS